MRDCAQKDSVNVISLFFPHPSHYCPKLQHMFISAIYIKNAANTASNHFIALTFNGCKQRENILLKCGRCFHHGEKIHLHANRTVYHDTRKDTKIGLSCHECTNK